jgi:hypothetical protein
MQTNEGSKKTKNVIELPNAASNNDTSAAGKAHLGNGS